MALLLLLVTAFFALMLGSTSLDWSAIFAVSDSSNSTAQVIVWELRAPRVVLAMVVGAALAVAGTLMQGLFRNPLADPGLLGVSMGSALFAVAVIVLAGSWIATLGSLGQTLALPLASFCGGLMATMTIYLIARGGGHTEVATMLLAGIAINAIAASAIGVLSYLADSHELRLILFWNLGSLARADWSLLQWLAPAILLLLVAAWRCAGALDVLALGEADAAYLGVSVERLQLILATLVALLVAAAVSVSGVIGFVGLVVPHILRKLVGPGHRALIPMAAIGGAILLVVADTAARVLIRPAELPIGVLTGLLGGPFFLWLLLRFRRGGYGW